MDISIITATYNAAATVTDCLRSVASQTYPCEHIIIDGASTDATLDTVRRMSPQTRILSEPDNGIYDAMNKGIAMATGEVIGILNADDFYVSPLVLEKVANVFEDPTVMGCYGDLEYVKEVGSLFHIHRCWKSGSFDPKQFYWGWMPPHPTFFVRRAAYERYGCFNTGLGSAADYELMLRLLLKCQISCRYIPEVLVRMRVGGASNATLGNRLRANRMDRKAWSVNGIQPYPWTILMKPLRKVLQWVRK